MTRYATVALEKSLLFATKTGTLMSLLVGRIAEVLMYLIDGGAGQVQEVAQVSSCIRVANKSFVNGHAWDIKFCKMFK